jgi:acyl carrier protein
MNDEQIVAVAIQHAREIFKVPDLEFDKALVFQEIRGFDSVQAVQFILAMEGALDVMLSEEDVDNMRTMGDMLDIVKARLAEKT